MAMYRSNQKCGAGHRRASRRAVEEAWQVFASLSSPIRPANLDGLEDSLAAEGADGAAADFCALGTPEAGRHRVLVAGATGRVGRVVCNKLLLRGYKVRALVRRVDEESLAKLPAAVEVVEGDVTDMSSVSAATRGCDKVVCCIRAPPCGRSSGRSRCRGCATWPRRS